MFPLPRGGKWLPVLAGLFISGLILVLVLAVTGAAEPTRGWPATVELVNITIPSTTPVAVAKPAGGSLPVKPPEHVVATQQRQVAPVRPAASPTQAHPTQASWYATLPPLNCWDTAGRHDVSRTRLFTAMRDIPCGTVVIISGAAGRVQVEVWDHGPWGIPGRDLDLSTEAFARAVGPVSQGTGPAIWQIP